MGKIFRYSAIGVVVLVLVFIFQNPTIMDLKEHIGFNNKTQVIKRKNNFLIFSVYEVYTKEEYVILGGRGILKTYVLEGQSRYNNRYVKETYIGFFKNFWE